MFRRKMSKHDPFERSVHTMLLCWMVLVVVMTCVEGDVEGHIKESTPRAAL